MGFLTDFTRDVLAIVGVVLGLIPIAASVVRYLSAIREPAGSSSHQAPSPKASVTLYWLNSEDRAFVVMTLVAAFAVSSSVAWFSIRLPESSTLANICSALVLFADHLQMGLVGLLLYDRFPNLRSAFDKAWDERNGAANFLLACISLPAFLLSLWGLSALDETTPLIVMALLVPYLLSLFFWSCGGLIGGVFLAFPATRDWL